MSTFQEREASQNVVVEVPGCPVVPGETARFPFRVRGGERSYSIHDFSASSDNPNFDQGWVHIVKATDEMGSSRFTLEIRPAHTGCRPYGTYPISIRCTAPDDRVHVQAGQHGRGHHLHRDRERRRFGYLPAPQAEQDILVASSQVA